MWALENRLEDLHDQLLATPDDERGPLLDHIEQAVLTLECQGVVAPGWAKVYLTASIVAEVEAQFDNMPL